MFEVKNDHYDTKVYFYDPTFIAITIYSEEAFDSYTKCLENLVERGYYFVEETTGSIPDIPVYINSALLICEDQNFKGIQSRILKSTEKCDPKALVYSRLNPDSNFTNYTFTGQRVDKYKNILNKYDSLKFVDTGTFWFHDTETHKVFSKLTGVLVFGKDSDTEKFEEEIGGVDAW